MCPKNGRRPVRPIHFGLVQLRREKFGGSGATAQNVAAIEARLCITHSPCPQLAESWFTKNAAEEGGAFRLAFRDKLDRPVNHARSVRMVGQLKIVPL